ncbi:putative signal transduction protein containing sensor and EAL domains [Legionella oakridgensis ATCC 33761 = DSM 21215]|uniref:Putative signal transduction protein containing sensor and EAL domains n=1 Tax=Legionella oakridgensis ATCC 33761 = DSM 21215 TaxID=1268635 RepID=W0BA47_9GAMM|nr:putative signal transduction protein containing sensor and EAL domains [Legionella oakridgensis ATCC 33761 = DSM 21215]
MNAVHEKRATAHVVLNIIWGVLSAILLVFVLYSSWEKAQLENHQSLWHAANEMTDQLDDFITDIMQSVYTMPIHGHDFNQCSTVLLSYLKHTVFNNPQISGLTIKNKQNQVICSTLLQADKQIVPNAQSLNLYGPIKFSTEDKPAFILQQQLGDYFIDVYVLQYLIEQQLKTTSPSIFRIALYNSNQNKVLLQITRESQSTVWQTDSPQQFIHFSANSDQPSFSIRDNLNSLEHFQLILFANPQQISQLAWGGIVMIALLMILGSFLIYFILRHLINRHFSLHRELIKAIKDKRFFPVYQPIFDNDRDVCIGAEVLLRWQDTQKLSCLIFLLKKPSNLD